MIILLVSLFRTFILFIAVMIGLRIMGKRQIGDLSPNELVVTILVSQIATIPLQDINQPVINGIISIFLLVIIEVVLSIITMKWGKARKIINGGPVVIINNGEINQKAMEELRMSIDDLQKNLRQQQIFDISEVHFGIVETDGTFSVMLKPEKRNVCIEDIDVKIPQGSVAVPVICDGEYQEEFISVMGLSKQTVINQLKARNLDIKDVFLMTLDANNKARVVKKERQN